MLRIVVPRKPVSVNAAYSRSGATYKRKGLFMTSAGRDYKDAVRAYAIVAARAAGWPKPSTVKACEVEITTWNTKHDAAAAEKLTCDSLEQIVYTNDRVIQSVTCRKATDGGIPRVEVLVRLVD
jgi:hypothetical protein